MRAVVQRVRSARVVVAGETVGAIGPGLVVLVGVANEDGPADVQYIAAKVRELRVFEDQTGKMNRSVGEAGGSILVVSQFTLYGDCRKGRRPSFDTAAPPAIARALYDDLVRQLREGGAIPVETGAFQARMDVELVNDGPVTLLLDSRKLF
jgi:D-tyrosyl-tRNA(Tyr) deacylase